MSNGSERPSVLKDEDWWACFLGWLILILASDYTIKFTGPRFAGIDRTSASL